MITDEFALTGLVLTLQADGGAVRRLPLRRVSRGTFATDIDLPRSTLRFAVIARTREGLRLRGTFELKLSAGS